ncbi:hypothetical protein IMZ48_40210 [Candidatus Bathyarchaeota archaeon]|nr:hypothetical protein [Candidatus Bathyarchaeota archaeon]
MGKIETDGPAPAQQDVIFPRAVISLLTNPVSRNQNEHPAGNVVKG